MARTKQTARKSSGGAAPRRQLATTSTSSFRSFLTSQQSSGKGGRGSAGAGAGAGGRGSAGGGEEKVIFINCENTFREFEFKRSKIATEVFDPIMTLGRVRGLPHPSINPPPPELYMRFDIASCLDGSGISIHGRPSIDLCFVLDISGSMGSPFPSDSDRRSKLTIAKSCLLSILSKLTESDRISLIQFDDRQDLLLPLTHVTSSTVTMVEEILSNIVPRGGTYLGQGIASGFIHLASADSITPPSSLITDIRQARTKRVIFMTDMESSPADETTVIQLAQDAVRGSVSMPKVQARSIFAPSAPILPTISVDSTTAAPPPLTLSSNSIFTSIIGIGVDLSVDTVERISSILGARYISAVAAAEFISVVAEEFPYDITPVGFNIRVTLPSQYTINKIFGASELNGVMDGSSSFTISSEFANPLNLSASSEEAPEILTKGGLVVIRLNEVGETKKTSQSKQVSFASESALPPPPTPRRSTRNKNKQNESTLSNSVAPPSLPNLPNDCVRVEWTDIMSQQHHKDLPLSSVPPLENNEDCSENCDVGLKKAVGLLTYVDYMERYAASAEKASLPSIDETNKESISEFISVPFHELIGVSASPLITLVHSRELPPRIIQTLGIIHQFQQFRQYLLRVLSECRDETIYTNNQNLLQTMTQVIDLEIQELRNDYSEYQRQNSMNSKSDERNVVDGEELCPYSFQCPISLTIMTNPVIASDGHSYERESILKWFETKNTSPVTNLPLTNRTLIDNHTLRSAIEEYKSKKETRTHEARENDSATTASSSSKRGHPSPSSQPKKRRTR